MTKLNSIRNIQIPLVSFFILTTFYFSVFGKHIFFFQEKSSLFLVSLDFLFEHLRQPGGFLKYLAEFQTALYHYELAGAFLISLEICLIVVLFQTLVKRTMKKEIHFLPYLIGGILFVLQTNYQFESHNLPGILIQLGLLFFVTTRGKEKIAWWIIFVYPVIFYLFGSFSFIFFVGIAILIGIKEDSKKWLKLLTLFIAAGLFFMIGKEFLFFQTNRTLLLYPFSISAIGNQSLLFFPVIFILALLPIGLLPVFQKIQAKITLKTWLIKLIPFVVISAFVVFAILKYDKKSSQYFHVERLFYEEKYDELIAYNKAFPSNNILTNYLNNIALCEKGLLSNSFLSFPQSPDGGSLFLEWEIIGEILKRGGYFYYNLGMINEAQRWAYEYMVMKGYTPEILKMLIKTELINENFNIAGKYISILKSSLFYTKEAEAFEKLLYSSEAIQNHPELGSKFNLRTKKDFFVLSDNPVANLNLVLNADSTNVAALEYKLAALLLQKKMNEIVEVLPLMETMGYKKIPKNVEEAIVTYKMLNVGKLPELKRLMINPDTEKRFQKYYQTYQQFNGNKLAAQKALARDFSDTYWYHVFFR